MAGEGRCAQKIARITAAFGLLLLLHGALHAAPPVRLTAAMAPLPNALSAAEVDAIVAEADAASAAAGAEYAAHHRTVSPLPAQWRTLDPERLVRLMRMPVFGAMRTPAHSVLMNQAGRWDLFGWQRPSDAAQLWERVWPRAAGSDPKNPPNRSPGSSYDPDVGWSTQARAMSTLFACLPEAAWRSDGDPMVEALRSPETFQWRNDANWTGFRDCVPQGAFWDDTRPDAAGLADLRAFLADRLAGELYVDGCARHGVEDCLFLLHALATLAPDDPRMPALVKHLAPAFDLDAPIAVPDVSANRIGELAEADRTVLLGAFDRAARRSLFLTHEIRAITGWPGAWPAGTLDEAVMRATEAGVLRARIERRLGWRTQMFDRYYDAPWATLDAATRRRLAPAQRAAGEAYARESGCATDPTTARVLPEFDAAARRVRDTLQCD